MSSIGRTVAVPTMQKRSDWATGNQTHRQDEDAMVQDGFSSEEELKQEEMVVQEVKNESTDQKNKEQVRFKVPPPQKPTNKAYSLHPDTVTGWKPKIELPTPIPLFFDDWRCEGLLRRLVDTPKQKAQLWYLGPCYSNTYFAWLDKSFRFPYGHIKAPNQTKIGNRPFCGPRNISQDGLIFESEFQSGNLDFVVKVGEREYDLFLRVDSNTQGHLQWFNFKVTNLKKLEKYKFNLCNMQKGKSLYDRGAKPYTFSIKRFERDKVGWEQAGQCIKYERKPSISFRTYDIQQQQTPSNYRLSFEYYSCFQHDEVQFSYCVPYTYSELNDFLKQLTSDSKKSSFIKLGKLCTSLGGLQVPLLSVGDEIEKHGEEAMLNRKCVVVCGRAHPGEANGSHMIQGFIEYICGPSKQAEELRKTTIFKIIPMLNPDGVCIGNYRTGLSGRDFNREYFNPDRALFPEVFAFKKLVTEAKVSFRERLVMFLDFHGHSLKKNTFVYGPQFPITNKYYYECRVFPKLLANRTNMFRYYSSIFRISDFKSATARAVMLRKLFIPLCYTIETSNGSFYDYEKLKDVPYNDDLWRQMGSKVGQALHDYLSLLWNAEAIREAKKQQQQQMAHTHHNKNAKMSNNNAYSDSPKKPVMRNRTTSKQSNYRSNQLPFEYNTLLCSVAAQDEKVKMLMDEIKRAEADKQLHEVSDDAMSEGSSDGEGEADDLSADKRDALFRSIKKKKCPFMGTNNDERMAMTVPGTPYGPFRTKTIDNYENPMEADSEQNGVVDKQEGIDCRSGYESQEVIVVRKGFRRGSSLRKGSNFEDKKYGQNMGGAKIINFNFQSRSPFGRSHDDKIQRVLKLNYADAASGRLLQVRPACQSMYNQQMVPSSQYTQHNIFTPIGHNAMPMTMPRRLSECLPNSGNNRHYNMAENSMVTTSNTTNSELLVNNQYNNNNSLLGPINRSSSPFGGQYGMNINPMNGVGSNNNAVFSTNINNNIPNTPNINSNTPSINSNNTNTSSSPLRRLNRLETHKIRRFIGPLIYSYNDCLL